MTPCEKEQGIRDELRNSLPSLRAALDNYFAVVDYGDDEQIFRRGLAEGIGEVLRDLVGFSSDYRYSKAEWEAAGGIVDALLANGIDIRHIRENGRQQLEAPVPILKTSRSL
jgi:hypothetical protein